MDRTGTRPRKSRNNDVGSENSYGDKGPRPDDVMDGCFVNYPDPDLIDWQHLYYKGNYERLQKVKQQWDPLNVFWHKQSLELP